MPAKIATISGTSPLVPAEVQPCSAIHRCFGAKMMASTTRSWTTFTKLVDPKDMIEWWWVKDMTDHTWEIRRLRRFKVLFVELQRDRTHENQKMQATVGLDEDEEPEPVPLPDSEKDSAEFYLIDRYKGVDRLIASAELRRDRTLREIERRRENLARRLRNASSEMVDGELAELPRAAA